MASNIVDNSSSIVQPDNDNPDFDRAVQEVVRGRKRVRNPEKWKKT